LFAPGLRVQLQSGLVVMPGNPTITHMAIVDLLESSLLRGLPAGLLALCLGVAGDEGRKKPGDSAGIFERHQMRGTGQDHGLGVRQHAA
jgi:hypothetical protein